MNLFQLVLKQMRQRALSTWLTLLSVLLGVALVVAIMILRREGQGLFGQSSYGYDLLIGAKGSPLQLVLNTVYHLDKSPGNIPYSLYEQLLTDPQYQPLVKLAIPYGVGDSYEGQRIVGTIPQLFGFDDAGQAVPAENRFEYRPGKPFELSEGVAFHPRKFEAVIGAEIPKLTGLKLGSKFKATHGLPAATETPDVHEQQWTVVGVLKPTHTAEDRVLFIPLSSYYAIQEHGEALGALARVRQGEGVTQIASSRPATTTTPVQHEAEEHGPAEASHDHDRAAGPAKAGPADAEHDHDHGPEHYVQNPDGTIDLTLPKDEWLLSAILVRTRGYPNWATQAWQLRYTINNRNEAQAAVPAEVMKEFFDIFLKPSSLMLLLIALLVTIVASVGILVSIYNSVSARIKEIAILRALGATRHRVLTLICVEAGLVGAIGAAIGAMVGHGLGAAGSVYMSAVFGEGIRWARMDWYEGAYLLGVVVLAVLAGLVPALKAYRTPVATNLVAS